MSVRKWTVFWSHGPEGHELECLSEEFAQTQAAVNKAKGATKVKILDPDGKKVTIKKTGA